MAGAADFQRAKTHCPKGHPYDEENTRHTRDGRVCRACRREAGIAYQQTPEGRAANARKMQKWRENNRDKDLARHKRRHQRDRQWLLEVKARYGGCQQCGEDHPACLDFHHRDPATKEFQIGRATVKKYPKEWIEREIAKCDVLCSNCHRKLHWDERELKREAAA